MSFLDDLRKIGTAIDGTVGVQANEVRQIVAALVAHAEHGDDLVKAAEDGPQAVSDLLTDVHKDVDTDEAQVTGQVDTDVDTLRRQVADLEAQLATRNATSHATVVEHNGETVTTGDTN